MKKRHSRESGNLIDHKLHVEHEVPDRYFTSFSDLPG